MPPGPLYLALIYLHSGQKDALRRYENLALPVFRRHGRRFERTLSPSPAPGGADLDVPDEIHLLGFETPDGLDAVRRDPAMVALVPLREAVVRKALLVRVEEVRRERYFTASS